MSEVVERVARAICAVTEGDEWWDVWRDVIPSESDCPLDYRVMARAAIEGMREPTEAMIDAIADAKMTFDEPTADDCRAVWQAGIAAALEEKP